jgi:UDP-galactopyranose mutase
MDNAFMLTLEQEFGIRSFADQVQNLSQEQAQQYLIDLYRQMIVKETFYKEFLAKQWGIDPA